MELVQYELYRDRMQTGDALLFAGRGVVSRIIQWRTHSPYTHVAMIVRWKFHQTERVFLCHATAQFGVHPVPASRYLAQHQGEAWWVPLDHDAAAKRMPEYRPKLLDASSLDFGRFYDTRGIGQFLVPRLFRQQQDRRFCSEAYASWLNAIGLSQETFVSPGSFIAQPIFTEKMWLG